MAAAAAMVGLIEAVKSQCEIRGCLSIANGDMCSCRPNSSLTSSCKWRAARLDARGRSAVSRSLFSTDADEFSDQGHLQFYAETGGQNYNRKSKSKVCCRSGLRQAVMQALGGSLEAGVSDELNVCSEKSGVSAGLNISFENIDAIKDAMKQLKALEEKIKARKKKLKDKEKEMKAQMKSKKERKCESSSSSSESDEGEDEIMMDKIKMQGHGSKELKQKKKEMKAKVTCERKSMCASSSSSSSESSDCEDEMCMDQIRMQLQQPAVVEPLSDILTVPFSQTKQLPAQTLDYIPPTVSKEDVATYGASSSERCSTVVDFSTTYADVKSSGRVEVCTGGKCRKDGSQHVLSAFEELIPSTSGVTVSACKCMGKCGKGPSVRVHSGEADNVPQVYTAVSEEDAKFLSHYHFGVTTEHGIAVIPVPTTDPGVEGSSIYAA